MRAWIASSFDDTPYDDRPGLQYEYDSNVQNHKQVAVGDLLFVRGRTSLHGVGRVSRIEATLRAKEISRCPACRSTTVHRRRGGASGYRCREGHFFEQPLSETTAVTAYQAHFDSHFIALERPISAVELRRFQLRNAQLAIMPAELDTLVDFVVGWNSEATPLLRWVRREEGALDDADADDGGGAMITPEGEDNREAVNRAIKLRRGQRAFREALFNRLRGAVQSPAAQLPLY